MLFKDAQGELPSKDAQRLKRAQTWLQRGKPLRALRLLQRMSTRAWKHRLVEEIMWHTAQVLG